MKLKVNLSRVFSTASFEKRITVFIVTTIIFIPTYIFVHTIICGKTPSEYQLDQIESRITAIEDFLKIEEMNSRFPFKRKPKTIADIIEEEIPDVSNLEDEIEEIKDLIQSLQRDSHYHY